MRVPDCVGAFIRDDRHRVYVHRRSADRRLLPGVWDVVGGHLDSGESPEEALGREIEEETGWTLRRIESVIAEWEWTPDDRHTSDAANRYPRLERDYLVEVDGDLDAPRLEAGKHDAYAWVGPDDLDLMMEGRIDDDRRLRDLVAKAVRTRLTERLRLEPIGPEHAEDLRRLHAEPHVADWYGAWSADEALAQGSDKRARWERVGVSKWMAYDRVSGDLVGRGGVDQLAVDNTWARHIAALLPGTGWADHRLELGWVVGQQHLGRGCATEIGRAGMEFARTALGAAAMSAFTEVDNTASRAVMERLGMELAGEFSGPVPSAGGEPARAARFVVYWADLDQI